MNNFDNRLPLLAEEIRAAHREVLVAANAGVTAARTAGRALLEAKEKVAHGRWLPWLRELGLGARTAQGYMQLARLDEANAQRVAHLGLRQALSAIADKPLEPPLPGADAVAKARQLLTDGLEYAIEAGHRLRSKKASVSHGEWLSWLKTNEAVLGFKEPTAQRLMKLAAKCDTRVAFSEAEATELLREIF